MKNKILYLSLLIVAFSCLGLMHPNAAKAEETKLLSHISVIQPPTKTVYGRGEEFDRLGMVVEAVYIDGTSAVVTDYQILYYDLSNLGNKIVWILYDNRFTYLEISTVPSKVVNVTATKQSDTIYNLQWDMVPNAAAYEIYLVDNVTGTMSLLQTAYENTMTLEVPSGNIIKFAIVAVENVYGTIHKGVFSDTFTIASKPKKVTNVSFVSATTSSITFTWDEAVGASGYIIYRAVIGSIDYRPFATTTTNLFTDTDVVSGTSYKYRIAAYTMEVTNEGPISAIVKYSTNPGVVALKAKEGDTKVRLTWPKVRGATSYDIYGYDEDGEVLHIETLQGNGSTSYLLTELMNKTTYSYYAVAQRSYLGRDYLGEQSKIVSVTPVVQKKTNTNARYFPKKADFLNSSAYKYLEFFQKNVNYSKSFIIPGLYNTEIDGFTSNAMITQGMTFAGDYLLITAYDGLGEENSVIYVMDKDTRKYITTIVLSSKTHAGGIAYDGHNIWITVGSRLTGFPLSEITKAVKGGKTNTIVNFTNTSTVGITASYVSYYNGMLWVGSYNELVETKMLSFSISEKKTEPVLTQVNTVVMPTRVQGVAFTKEGQLIISRSCQIGPGYRGYMRQLDVHMPLDNKETKDGILLLGELINTVDMPSMNEEIAISGSYLYVNFESASFANASYKVDRVTAFKLSSIIDLPQK